MSNRVLALDIGTVRTGAAISDPSRIIAQGLGVWPSETWRENLRESVRKYEPAVIVVGLPLRTDGKHSEAGQRILEIIGELKTEYAGCEVVAYDERFTTVIAQRVMIEADVSRKNRKKSVDKVAAVIILESWLEANR